MRAKSSVRVSALMRSNCREMLRSALRSDGVFSSPTSRWPVLTRGSPNIKVPYTQPRSTAFSTCAERSEIDVAPRGRRSSASVTSCASRD